MGRPAKIKNRVESYARAYGETKGALDAAADFKLKQKGQTESFSAHIGKFFDAMGRKVDPLEVAAVAATTYFVHELIMQTAGLVAKINGALISPEVLKSAGGNSLFSSLGLSNLASGGPAEWINALEQSGMIELVKALGLKKTEPAPETPAGQTPPADASQAPQDSLFIWVVSFLAAYVIIRFGPAIITSLGGITGIVKLFAGIA